jgi:tRNA A58 N-methylase Trm61
LTPGARGRDPEAGESESGRFLALLSDAIEGAAFVRLVLATYRGAEAGLTRVTVRRVAIRGEDHLSFLYHYRTRDVTTNFPIAAGLKTVRGLLRDFGNAHALTATEEIQLALSKKGRYSLRIGKAAQTDLPSTAHDREKSRMVELDQPFLAALGVTNAQHQLVPAMSRKWKQINKFIEVVDHAMTSSGLKAAGRVRVADFGAGKGYLTFAVHDYLQHTLGLKAEVTGVELREDLVRFCQAAVQQLGIEGLSFRQGDIASHTDAPLDIMIALHACDTATDHAIHRGIRSGAAIILCSPCCHKEIRPQMTSPPLLRPLLGHGIHLNQEAEMVTDSLRALLLEAHGYAAQVFEFVSLEHTSKNKMILAVKRVQPAAPDHALAQIRELKAFYGIREQCLETLLNEA